MSTHEPTGARFVDDRVFEIAWRDGRVLHYAPEEVRAACPCAHCVSEEESGTLREPARFGDVRLKRLDEVGRYAFQLTFSDGHELGIYPYDQLRGLGHAEGAVPPPPSGPETFEV